MKVHEMVGHNLRTNRLDLSDLDSRSRLVEVKGSKSFLRITPIKVVVASHHEIKMYSLYNSLNISKHNYGAGLTVLKTGTGQRSED